MKSLNTALQNNKLSKVLETISTSLGLKPSVFKIVPLKMYRITQYECPILGLKTDLKEYFIDEDGDLYTRNTSTYFTNYGLKLRKLSNECPYKGVDKINSLRNIKGKKITIRRSVLINMMKMNKFEDVTDVRLENILKGA